MSFWSIREDQCVSGYKLKHHMIGKVLEQKYEQRVQELDGQLDWQTRETLDVRNTLSTASQRLNGSFLENVRLFQMEEATRL